MPRMPSAFDLHTTQGNYRRNTDRCSSHKPSIRSLFRPWGNSSPWCSVPCGYCGTCGIDGGAAESSAECPDDISPSSSPCLTFVQVRTESPEKARIARNSVCLSANNKKTMHDAVVSRRIAAPSRAISNVCASIPLFHAPSFATSTSELFRVTIRVPAPLAHISNVCVSILFHPRSCNIAHFQAVMFRLQLLFPLFDYSTFARIQRFAYGHRYTVRNEMAHY
jgi:hypothetical protein